MLITYLRPFGKLCDFFESAGVLVFRSRFGVSVGP